MPEDARRLGNLLLVRELGRGGMGTVWEALQEPTGQRVAVKCLHPEKTRSDRALTRFRREADVLLRVSHPTIVPVLEARLDGDRPHLVMPYVEGRSLWEIVRGLRSREAGVAAFCMDVLPEITTPADLRPGSDAWTSAMVRLGRDVAEALAVAHAQGLVHRDLKPGNIMVDESGAARLLDFGLVRDERAPAMTLTLSDERLGTPLYMSPEQVTRRQPVDHRTDLYALGVTLVEALTQQAPLKTDDLSDLYRAIVEDDPMRVARRTDGLSPALIEVLSAAVRKRPVDRYQDAGAFARDLGRVLDHRDPSPPRVPLARRAGAHLRRHARAGLMLLLLGVCTWLVASVLSDPVTQGDGPDQELALADAYVLDGDYGSALRHFNDILARYPGHDRAVTGLRSVARALEERARAHEAGFSYSRAAADLELLRRIEPEGVAPDRLERLESLAYRTLGRIAVTLLDADLPLERRLRSLERLREQAAELTVPADERERLLLKLLATSASEPRVISSVLTVAAGFRVATAAPLARRFLDDASQPAPVRLAAAVLLARVGIDAGRLALEATAADATPEGEEALAHLSELGHKDSVPLLVKELASDDPVRLRLAARGLARAPLRRLDEEQRASVASSLSRVLETVDEVETGAAAAAAAGALSGVEGESLLVRLLRDRDRPVALRASAARWLGHRRSDLARSTLVETLGSDASEQVRGAAALALRPRTPPSVNVLMQAARGDPDENVRARALIALGRSRVREALAPAVAVLRKSKDVRARVGAILSLGLLREPDSEAVDLLTQVLRRGRHPHERLSAAWALGRLDNAEVLPALITILKEESARIEARDRAQDALVGASSGLVALLGQLGEDVGTLMGRLPELVRAGGRTREPAEGIAIAMAELVRGADAAHAADAQRAVDALVTVARDARRPALRAAAIGALGRLPAYVDRSGPVLRKLQATATRREVRRALALALTRLGETAAGEAWLAEPPRDGEDALVRALVLLRLGREAEARRPFLAATRLGVLDRTRLSLEPEFVVLAALADALGL